MNPMKVVFCGDPHCGHMAGLTPPPWWLPKDTPHHGVRRLHSEMWRRFRGYTRKHAPVDLVVLNGDGVDGKGKRSGGIEQIVSDRHEQADMCVLAMLEWRKGSPKCKFAMRRGTPYHVGQEEDFERVIAERLDCELETARPMKIGGVVVNIKHKVGRSSIPHGRHTAPARARLQDVLRSEQKKHPKAGIIIRSHVHYYGFCGGTGWMAMTLPALQSWTRYGEGEMDDDVDWGLVVFDFDGKGGYSWTPEIVTLQAAVQNPQTY